MLLCGHHDVETDLVNIEVEIVIKSVLKRCHGITLYR